MYLVPVSINVRNTFRYKTFRRSFFVTESHLYRNPRKLYVIYKFSVAKNVISLWYPLTLYFTIVFLSATVDLIDSYEFYWTYFKYNVIHPPLRLCAQVMCSTTRKRLNMLVADMSSFHQVFLAHLQGSSLNVPVYTFHLFNYVCFRQPQCAYSSTSSLHLNHHMDRYSIRLEEPRAGEAAACIKDTAEVRYNCRLSEALCSAWRQSLHHHIVLLIPG